MNMEYLLSARERIPNVPLLINVVARRVLQLNAGQRPMIKPESPNMQTVDMALLEISEGKLTAEINFAASPLDDGKDKVISLA